MKAKLMSSNVEKLKHHGYLFGPIKKNIIKIVKQLFLFKKVENKNIFKYILTIKNEKMNFSNSQHNNYNNKEELISQTQKQVD